MRSLQSAHKQQKRHKLDIQQTIAKSNQRPRHKIDTLRYRVIRRYIDITNNMTASENKKIISHHHHHHAPFIHDLVLMNYLTCIWLGIVALGFIIDQIYHQYVHEQPSMISSIVPSFSGNWTSAFFRLFPLKT